MRTSPHWNNIKDAVHLNPCGLLPKNTSLGPHLLYCLLMLPQPFLFERWFNLGACMTTEAIWDDKFTKIWTLYDAGGEQRTQALSLLDALLDSAVAAGQAHRYDRLFSGITITTDGLTIPKGIHDDVDKIKVNRWNRKPFQTAIQNCRLIEIYELYFRIYPKRIKDLPTFLCLEACTHVPNFCGPDSPVRALGLLPPFYGLDGIERHSNIERVHFYSSVPTFVRYSGLCKFIRRSGLRSSEQLILKGAEQCCSTQHVRHIFTDRATITVESTKGLLSTNLLSKEKGSGTLKYAAMPKRIQREPLLESVTQDINGQSYVVVDATGLTNGNIEEHPHLVVATNFLDHLPEFLAHKTRASFLELRRGVKVYGRTSLERMSFFLNDDVEAPVSERVIAIEAENTSADLQNLLNETTLSNCRQITLEGNCQHYNHKLNLQLTLSVDLLSRYPSLEVVSIETYNYGHKVELTIDASIWAMNHPLRCVEINLQNNGTGIGFGNAKGTLSERLMTWQDTEVHIRDHVDYIGNIQHLYIRNPGNVAYLIPSIPNIKTFVTYPYGLKMNATKRDRLTFSDDQRRVHFDEVYQYRPTSMLSVKSIKDLSLLVARKEVVHRAVCNRKPKVSSGVHAEIDSGMIENQEEMSRQLTVLSQNTGVLKLGRKMYIQSEEGWVRRNYVYIDEEYTNRKKRLQWLNLDLAYKVRAFSLETLPKVFKVRLNTERVTLMNLVHCDWIRSLRIDRALSAEEWSALTQFQNLETLYVSNLGFETMESIYPEVLTLKNLRELYLPNQEISSVPEDIKKLVHLEKLSLRGNPIGREEQDRLIVYLQSLSKFKKLYFDVHGFPVVSFSIY